MYSSKFLKAFDYVLKHEGGYVNDPIDPGGETKWGISKRSYPDLNIKDLTLDQAREIYHRDFWIKAKCESIVDDNIAIKFFDLCVNMGISQAVKLIQRALRAAGTQVVEDGAIGPAHSPPSIKSIPQTCWPPSNQRLPDFIDSSRKQTRRSKSSSKAGSIAPIVQQQSKRKENIMTNLKDMILNEKTKGIVAIVAAIITYFTPDSIDVIIESLLGIYGITVLTLQKKDEPQEK